MKFALSLLLLALTSVSAARVPPSHYPADVAALMDFSVDPCDDFYLYSCGAWVNQTVLPPQDAVFERAISGIFANNTATLLAILNNATSSYPKIKDFYDNCLDTNTIEQLGFAPLQKYWDVLTVDNIAQFMDGVGFLHSFQIPAFFAFGVTPDPLNPQTLIGEFDQAGFALPYPGLYNTSDPSSQKILTDYQQHIELMFNLAGDSDPASRAKEVIELESLLASVNLPGDQIRDPYSVYHKIDLGGLQSLTPNLPWPAYLEAIGAPGLTSLNVAEPSFFQAANKIIASVSVKTLETHLRWNLLHAAAPLMSSAFANATFAFFNAELSGQTAMQPRSRSCVSATDAALGNILGQAYADVAFGSVAQEMITAMVGQIEAAFGEVLTGLDWMDPDTKAKAQMKLSQVTRRVGAPQQPSFYPDYDVLPNQYLESVFTKNAYDFNQTVSRLGQAPDKDAWQMTADTVNAYYNPQDNSINFPAGILQNPYFDVSRDPAQNFGGAGVIMGHELTHGFDDQGRMYDGNGKLSNWWSNSSAAHYEESSMCMANQYSQFQVLPGVHINGNLTLGENIADNGGVKNSFDAYVKFVHKVRHGSYRSLMRSLAEMKHPRVRTQHGAPVFQEDHPLFFVSYAQGWCAKATDAYLQMQVQTDVHSNFKFRVLGPLMNFQPFADTFECPVDHPMNPKTKCTVW